MTTEANILGAFRALPEVMEVTISPKSGSLTIRIQWCGRGPIDTTIEDICRKSIAVGIGWTVEIRAWRWRWLRAFRWPGMLRSIGGPTIRAGTMLSTINGRQFVLIGEDTDRDTLLARSLVEDRRRSLWRRVMFVIAKGLLSIATRGGSL